MNFDQHLYTRTMIQRLRNEFDKRRHDLLDGLWFLPTIITIALGLLALVLVGIDRILWDSGRTSDPSSVFRGGVDGSRGVLTAIAGSIISATALVFSITVVTLQLASSQFTPRVLRSFTGDRQFQVSLGILLGTFTYSLITLWSLGHETQDREPFVPTLATAGAIVLALVSVAILILFIQRVASLIQVSVLVDEVTGQTVGLVKRSYLDPDDDQPELSTAPEFPSDPGAEITSTKSGYIRTINTSGLLELAGSRNATIVMAKMVGDFVLDGSIIAHVHPASEGDDEAGDTIRRNISIGPERTTIEDVDLGVRQVSDIALKSLSPGINDPTTAISCIDSLSEIFAEIVRRQPPAVVKQAESGGMVVVREVPTFDQLLDSAFTQVRHYGAADVVVAEHLVLQLKELTTIAPELYREEFMEQARLVAASSCSQLGEGVDCDRVRDASTWAMADEDAE